MWRPGSAYTCDTDAPSAPLPSPKSQTNRAPTLSSTSKETGAPPNTTASSPSRALGATLPDSVGEAR